MRRKEINIAKLIGKGYRDYWNDRNRYVVAKGGRASKKSKTTALWHIFHMMKHWGSNTLVVRRYFITHLNSTYSDLIWAQKKLGVSHLWKNTKSPLMMEYLPTGQKILFRGLDNPDSITSISVEHGNLCWVWIEEAYQIKNSEEIYFDKLDMSIRGELENPELWKQIRITFNPWSRNSWLKRRFFDVREDEKEEAYRLQTTSTYTTTYRCNEFLDASDILQFENLSERRKKVEADGDWGIIAGLVYENYEIQEFDLDKPKGIELFGLDFGYTDPNAVLKIWLDETNKKIYICDEIYKSYILISELRDLLVKKGWSDKRIYCESARPDLIQYLQQNGIYHAVSIQKKETIEFGIQQLHDYQIVIHPICQNFITEIENYVYDEEKGRPIDDYNHLLDALRYIITTYFKSKSADDIEDFSDLGFSI